MTNWYDAIELIIYRERKMLSVNWEVKQARGKNCIINRRILH
jgi:hypothetical protein